MKRVKRTVNGVRVNGYLVDAVFYRTLSEATGVAREEKLLVQNKYSAAFCDWGVLKEEYTDLVEFVQNVCVLSDSRSSTRPYRVSTLVQVLQQPEVSCRGIQEYFELGYSTARAYWYCAAIVLQYCDRKYQELADTVSTPDTPIPSVLSTIASLGYSGVRRNPFSTVSNVQVTSTGEVLIGAEANRYWLEEQGLNSYSMR
ncbi:hypothetical protein [Pectobacterium phage Peat1]|uniref:Uncharacterized protein n=1 Tax=Pectobacterium phage Peat1 TaxID=1654601 RepID=A0A0H3YI46_9CAUD|nr:hypothetical protein AXI77_gp58 [Pectobacterium phage Peat1]AKN21215.1 hypothetical protein [Pectobacterium phage Peat1]